MAMPRVKGSISNGTSKDRDKNDFYETPQAFTRELLKRSSFQYEIWEPAAGKGAISQVLREEGHSVIESDLVVRKEGIEQLDFLKADKVGYDIITNPPFKYMSEFAEQAYLLCGQKFAMVMPISGLNSSKRYQRIWSHMPLSQIILSGRYQHINSERGVIPSQFTHIWAVFDKGHEGKPTFEWCPDIVYKGE